MLYHGDQQLIKDENSAFQMAALSVIGDREDQQDSLGYVLKQDEGLVIVCDGMGGHEGGKMASEFLDEYESGGRVYDYNYLYKEHHPCFHPTEGIHHPNNHTSNG